MSDHESRNSVGERLLKAVLAENRELHAALADLARRLAEAEEALRGLVITVGNHHRIEHREMAPPFDNPSANWSEVCREVTRAEALLAKLEEPDP